MVYEVNEVRVDSAAVPYIRMALAKSVSRGGPVSVRSVARRG